MIVFYVFLGIVLAFIGGAPLGVANIAVTTTSQHSLSKAMQIAYGAGIGEVTLALIALFYSQMLTDFFAMNRWIQFTFIAIFLVIGIYLLLPRRPKFSLRTPVKTPTKLVTGFLLALINPPVLLYWLVILSLSQKYLLAISEMSPLCQLLLFFGGVFLGKVMVLYFYGKWSRKFQKQHSKNHQKLYKYIGVALILISIAQGFRFAIG